MADIVQKVIDIFTEAFIKIMVNSKDIDINPSQLKQESRKHRVDNWLNIQRAFTGGSGLLTGILGGPWAYAGEVGDIAILLRSISRGCFGTGYILQNSVNYKEDMICIMALWTGYASIISIPSDIRAKSTSNASEAAIALTSIVPTGKIGIKLLLKSSASNPEFVKLGSKLYLFSLSALMKKGGTKSAVKSTPKLVTKIAQKGAGKVVPKVVTKAGTKWIPVVGGVLSAGINLWVYTEITHSALKYYKAITTQGNILVMNESLFKDEQIKSYQNKIRQLEQEVELEKQQARLEKQQAKEEAMKVQENITKRIEKLEKQRLLEYQSLEKKKKLNSMIIFSIILLSVLLVVILVINYF